MRPYEPLPVLSEPSSPLTLEGARPCEWAGPWDLETELERT